MQIMYPAVFINQDNNVTVVFPDLPGCTASAKSLERAFINAQNAAYAHIVSLRSQLMPVPSPSSLTTACEQFIGKMPHFHGMLVPISLPTLTVRTNITMDEGLLHMIDRVTTNRSQFLAEAAVRELERRRNDE